MKRDQSRAYALCYVSPPPLQIQSMGPFTERLRFSIGALDKGWSPKCCFGKDETTLAVFIFNSGDLVRKIFLKNGRKSNSALTKCGLLLGRGREPLPSDSVPRSGHVQPPNCRCEMKGNLSTFPPIVWAFSLLCYHNILFWNSINVGVSPPPETIRREQLAKPARKDLWLTLKWVTITCLGMAGCCQGKEFEPKEENTSTQWSGRWAVWLRWWRRRLCEAPGGLRRTRASEDLGSHPGFTLN